MSLTTKSNFFYYIHTDIHIFQYIHTLHTILFMTKSCYYIIVNSGNPKKENIYIINATQIN